MKHLLQSLDRDIEISAKATKGPWRPFDNGPWGGKGAGIAIGDNHEHWVVFGERTEEPHVANSFFTAHARTRLPQLAAALKVVFAQDRTRGYPTGTEWIAMLQEITRILEGEGEG